MQTPARSLPFVFLVLSAVSASPASAASTGSEIMLRVTSPAVPIVKEGIVAKIDHRYAISDHHQVARNASGGQTEGSYLLSTGERSVMTQFTYWNGNVPVRGELFERDAANRMYDTVTRVRRDPGILEELSPNNFRYRIFPFEGGEMKRIDVRWETWLPARGRVVEYHAPLAIPQSAPAVVLASSLRGVVVRSPTHELVVEPAASGETYVRAVAPRTANPTDFVLQYELPATNPTGAKTFADLDKNGDAFVAVDFAPPDRLVDQLKLEVEGATGIVHAAPMPATLANERTTLVFRCHPNAGVSTLRATLTGSIDGRPTVIMREAVDVSPRGRLAPWVGTLWGATRMRHLATEAAKPGGATAPGVREEIVELSFRHELTSPYTAFFAIPGSEAWRVQGQLADARRQKRWLTDDGSGGSGDVAMSPTIQRDNAEPSPVPAVERRSGGCGGCATSPSDRRASFAGSFLLFALVAVAVRRRGKVPGTCPADACSSRESQDS